MSYYFSPLVIFLHFFSICHYSGKILFFLTWICMMYNADILNTLKKTELCNTNSR